MQTRAPSVKRPITLSPEPKPARSSTKARELGVSVIGEQEMEELVNG